MMGASLAISCQRHLVPLRHEVTQLQAAGHQGARGQAKIIDDDGDIVARIQFDVARRICICCQRGGHRLVLPKSAGIRAGLAAEQ